MRSRRFPEEIVESQQDVLGAFNAVFSEAGFIETDPEPLIPRADDSVIFTNATITSLKPLIYGRSVPIPGVFLTQPCLRVQNGAKADQGIDPSYMSYFRMPGALGHPDSLDTLCATASEFFFQRLEIEPDDLLIRANDECRLLVNAWQRHCPGAAIEWNSRPPKYYHWIYGMPDVDGVGFTFAIKCGQSAFEDCGNLVAMSLRGAVAGYEFGVGLETMLARMHGLRSPFEAALISTIRPFCSHPDSKMLQDCIVVTSVLFRAGIRPGTGRARYIAKRVIAMLYEYAEKLGLSTDELVRAINEFENKEFGNETGLGNEVQKALIALEAGAKMRATAFEDMVRGKIHLAKKKGTVLDSAQLQTLRERGLDEYRLTPDSIEAMFCKYLT